MIQSLFKYKYLILVKLFRYNPGLKLTILQSKFKLKKLLITFNAGFTDFKQN